ncbi:hypothetical protein [Alkaliphilus sp. B6464]|uniref:hypothetical protein n=1 Tax=Alkaliphilus sp. B6464 TaxID=2731219 RepID=UPI001BA48F3C|nr:hypothetical protein [Alkaliphilus sp. B6464]QUH22162.1 hypothetical protein HYG84_19840 [Alkaliphilus sp. B6464]
MNGGFYATSIVSKNDISNLIIVPVLGYQGGSKGLLIAFDKNTGEEIWSWGMSNYTW